MRFLLAQIQNLVEKQSYRAATVHAFQGRTVDRILATMPAENPRPVNQCAFYVAISRARDPARLVTDGAWKLADRLERATGERLAALEATAKRAARETVFGRETGRDGGGDPLTRAPDAMDRGHGLNGGRHRIERQADRDRAGKSRGRSAERERSGIDSGGKDHGLHRGGERQADVSREREHNEDRRTEAEDARLRPRDVASRLRFRPARRRRQLRNVRQGARVQAAGLSGIGRRIASRRHAATGTLCRVLEPPDAAPGILGKRATDRSRCWKSPIRRVPQDWHYRTEQTQELSRRIKGVIRRNTPDRRSAYTLFHDTIVGVWRPQRTAAHVSPPMPRFAPWCGRCEEPRRARPV